MNIPISRIEVRQPIVSGGFGDVFKGTLLEDTTRSNPPPRYEIAIKKFRLLWVITQWQSFGDIPTYIQNTGVNLAKRLELAWPVSLSFYQRHPSERIFRLMILLKASPSFILEGRRSYMRTLNLSVTRICSPYQSLIIYYIG